MEDGVIIGSANWRGSNMLGCEEQMRSLMNLSKHFITTEVRVTGLIIQQSFSIQVN